MAYTPTGMSVENKAENEAELEPLVAFVNVPPVELSLDDPILGSLDWFCLEKWVWSVVGPRS